MSLVTRIFALIAFMLLLVAGGELTNGLNLRQNRLAEVRSETLQLARIAELDVIRILEGTHQLLATLAKLPMEHGWDKRACKVIEATTSSDFEYDHIVAVDRDGITVCSSSGSVRPVSDLALFNRVVATSGFAVGSYGKGQVSGNEVIRVGYPVVDDAGAVVGVLYAGINVAWLNTAISQWEIGEAASIDITDRNGILIARHPDPQGVGQPISDSLKPLLSATSAGTAEVKRADAIARLYGYVPVSVGQSDGLAVFVGRDQAQIFADINRSILLNAAVALIALLLSAVFAIIYVRRLLARPFQNLLTAAGRWRDGDWSTRTGKLSGIPEFDRLSSAFDGMAAAVSARDRSLRQERDFTTALIDSLPGLFVLIDERGRLVRWNENMADLSGVPSAQLQGFEALEIFAENDRDLARTKMSEAFTQDVTDFEGAVLKKDGGTRTIQFSGRRLTRDGHPYLLAVGTDVTEKREAEVRLRASEERFRAVSEAAQDAIIMVDRSGKIVYWNRAAERILGYTADEEMGTNVHQWLAPQHLLEKAEAGTRNFALIGGGDALGKTVELAATRKDGIVIPVEVSIASMLLGAEWHAVAILRDITERKRIEVEMTRMARHDILTGLANRRVFVEALEAAIALTHRGGRGFAVLYLDLDQFKDVNDTLGHPAGDQLLRETAQRLKTALRETDVLARLGGDEFAIIQSSQDKPREEAASLADRIVRLISKPYDIGGNMVSVGASIGIALAPEDAVDGTDLLKMADLALYAAKTAGRNGFRFFDSAMQAEADHRRKLEDQLRIAISRGEFELHYQPVIDVKTRRQAGFEALVRWRDPARGLVMPDQFIPLAEETGLIVPLGVWTLQQACKDAVKWPSHIKVAVNLSPVQLAQPDLLEVVLCALVEASLPPERLELEITEIALFRKDADCLKVLRQLKQLGISIAIDDFGTGYASLSHLTMFPFDKIKIDRSFTANLTRRADCAAIVSAVLALGHGLEIETVAEGVETEQQFGILRAAGVTFVQGYLFGPPCPASDLVLDDAGAVPLVESAA